MKFNPLDHPVCLQAPKMMDATAWAGHIPFAMYLISAFRPRILVELGTYRGVSYCGFCQAVQETKAETRCFAVDTWSGDDHAGTLEDSAYAKLAAYHDPRYGGFSKLIRSTFDDALAEFEDASVDVLHIDGFHTYEAVRHDFETWLPKVSPGGIVLFHDTCERSGDFGVWKFWEELKEKYPTFEFQHSHGLGVLSINSNPPVSLQPIFSADETESKEIRCIFEALGFKIDGAERIRILQETEAALRTYEAIVKASPLRKAYRYLKMLRG